MAAHTSLDGVGILYTVIGVLCQTLFYGIYAALIPFSTYIMVKKGVKTQLRRFLFCMTIFMFLLSTVYWALSVQFMVKHISKGFIHPDDAGGPRCDEACYHSIFSALILVNYLLTDGVVVWRAWVICHTESRRMIILAGFFLGCTTLSVLATIGIRMALTQRTIIGQPVPNHTSIARAIDVTQVGNLIFSLLTNITATSTVAWKAWRHRQWIRDGLQTTRGQNRDSSTKGERVLLLLMESGFLYCMSGILVLIATVIKLPAGTLGDIYTPVNVQIAGIYPTVVLLLVNQQRSLNETALSGYWVDTTVGLQTGHPNKNKEGQLGHPTSRRGSTVIANGHMQFEALKFASVSLGGSHVTTSEERERGDVSGDGHLHRLNFSGFDHGGGSKENIEGSNAEESDDCIHEVKREGC